MAPSVLSIIAFSLLVPFSYASSVTGLVPTPSACSSAVSIVQQCTKIPGVTTKPSAQEASSYAIECMCYTAIDRYGDKGWRGSEVDAAFSQCYTGYSSLAAKETGVAGLGSFVDSWKIMAGMCAKASPTGSTTGAAHASSATGGAKSGNATASPGAKNAAVGVKAGGEQLVLLLGGTIAFAGFMVGFL